MTLKTLNTWARRGLFLAAVMTAGCASSTETDSAATTKTAIDDGAPPVEVTPATPETAPDETTAFVRIPSTADFELSSAGMPDSGMWKCDPVFVDINRDGHLDIAAIPRLGNGPQVWLNDGAGNWTESSKGLTTSDSSCGGGVALGDVNGDGHLDLCVADHCQGIFVYLGDGGMNWTQVVRALYSKEAVTDTDLEDQFVGAEDLDVGDINGDGFLDLVSASSDRAGLSVWLGDGSGTNFTWQPNILPRDGWANRVRLVDIDGSGSLDLLTSYSTGPKVYLNDGAGNWTDGSADLPQPQTHGIFHAIDPVDVNGDGRLDIAVANWFDGPEVYLQREGGTWNKMADVFPEMIGGAIGIAGGDIDRDGHLDLVVTGRLTQDLGRSRGVYLLLGNGDGSFGFAADSGLPMEGLLAMTGVDLGDINGDGTLDVVACSGLKVESVFNEEKKPEMPAHLLVWRSMLRAPATAANRK